MDEVICVPTVTHVLGKRIGIVYVAAQNLGPLVAGPFTVVELSRISGEAANGVAGFEQPGRESTANIAGRPSKEDAVPVCS